MGLAGLFSAGSVPKTLIGRTLVLGEGADLVAAAELISALETKLGPIALGVVGDAPYDGPYAQLTLPREHGADRKRLKRLSPSRVIVVGRADKRFDLLERTSAPTYWLNAASPEAGEIGCALVTVASELQRSRIPTASLTGDPVLGLSSLPAIEADPAVCERFKEYRDRGHWIVYASGTGDHEEATAYGLLFELLRHKTAILVLAPRDPERYEPVYRDAIKYNLPTIRHSRLMTSYVPNKNRVYFVEASEALLPLYQCPDLVILGGTLQPHSGVRTDLLTPLLLGRPVIAGPIHDDALTRSAVGAGVVPTCEDIEALAKTALRLLEDPQSAHTLAEGASAWLRLQPGARERVIRLID